MQGEQCCWSSDCLRNRGEWKRKITTNWLEAREYTVNVSRTPLNHKNLKSLCARSIAASMKSYKWENREPPKSHATTLWRWEHFLTSKLFQTWLDSHSAQGMQKRSFLHSVVLGWNKEESRNMSSKDEDFSFLTIRGSNTTGEVIQAKPEAGLWCLTTEPARGWYLKDSLYEFMFPSC